MSAVVPIQSPSLVTRMASRYGVDPDKMLHTLKATAFKGDVEVTNEQLMALLVVAEQHGLNPWTGGLCLPEQPRHCPGGRR